MGRRGLYISQFGPRGALSEKSESLGMLLKDTAVQYPAQTRTGGMDLGAGDRGAAPPKTEEHSGF